MLQDTQLDNSQRRQYTRISNDEKRELLHLVFKKGMNIKQASCKLNIKYGAAKAFVAWNKFNKYQKNRCSGMKRCNYKKLVAKEISKETDSKQQIKYSYSLIVRVADETIVEKLVEISHKDPK